MSLLSGGAASLTYAPCEHHGRLTCSTLASLTPEPLSLSFSLPAGSLTDGQLVGHEVPLLMGLQYTLTVHHAYRPLRALLAAVVGEYMAQADAQARAAGAAGAAGAVVSAAAASSDASHSPVATPSPIPTAGGAGAGSSAGSGSAGLLSPEDPSFVAAWDALQGRAFALVDVSLATDAPFLYTPAQVAAACLLLAARTDTLPAAAADASSAAGSSHAGGGAPQLHSAMARQLLAKAHSHGAPSSASSLTCAADVAATSMQSDGPGDDRARALPSAERGHHAAALGLGWWDDSALLTSAPAAVASFVEPCVRRMIAAEAAAAAAPAAAAVGLAAAAHEAAEEAAEAAAVAAAEAAAAQALDLDAGDADAAEAAAPSTAAVKTRKGRAGARAAAIDAVTGERLSRAAAQLLAGIDHAATLVHEALSDSVKACQEGLPWQQELSGLLQKLSESMSPASLPGTVAYAQRLAAAKDVRVAYKAEKAASRAAASKMAADSDVSGGVA